MLQLSQEMSSGAARLRIDVFGSKPCHHVLETMTFLNYRLANVNIEPVVTRPKPDIVWNQDLPAKNILCEDGTLTLRGEWFPGELQKILVSMIASKMEEVGLHPFHASAIRYRDLTIMFLGGESNHGKSMAQIEGSKRGALVVSTETTVTDERGWAVMGSKSVFLRERAKGTERADKLDQDQCRLSSDSFDRWKLRFQNGVDDSIRTELPDFPLADGLPGRKGAASARARDALAR
jgi:hypothetical protein